MKIRYAFLALFVLLVAGNFAHAQEVKRIAAVVNDSVISTTDVEERMRLIMTASGRTDASPEARARLRPQVLRNLIEDELKLQEAKHEDIIVSDQEINEAFAELAQQNNLSADQFSSLMTKTQAPRSSLDLQLRAQIAWSKLIRKKLVPKIQIGDAETEAVIKRLQTNAGKNEYLLAEIFLSADSPQRDVEAKKTADQLVADLRKGASFMGMARQFSQSASAAKGGDLGWIQEGQLAKEIDNVLPNLKEGDISDPIRSPLGYHILAVRQKRQVLGARPEEAKVTLRQYTAPLPETVTPATVNKIGGMLDGIRKGAGSCEELEKMAEKDASYRTAVISDAPLANLTPPLRAAILPLKVNEKTPVLRNKEGLSFFMVCGREEAETNKLPSREEITNVLGNQRLDMLQRRYLNDLRSSAFIEIRD